MQLYLKFYSAGNHFLFISIRSCVRTAVGKVKLTFIGHFSSNCSVFYLLYIGQPVQALEATLRYAHV